MRLSELEFYKRSSLTFASRIHRELHILFPETDPFNSKVLRSYGQNFIYHLPRLTTITLHNVNLDAELMVILGRLEYLTTLAYDVPLPHTKLRRRDCAFGEFNTSWLRQMAHRLPRKLKSLYIQFTCRNETQSPMDFLRALLTASSQTLTTIVISLYDIMTWQQYTPDAIFSLRFPNLTRLAIYRLATWTSFSQFYELHSSHLKEVQILAQVDIDLDFQGDTIQDRHQLHRMPGMESLNQPEAALTWRSYDACLEKDPTGELSIKEIAITTRQWEILRPLAQRHEYIRVLNIWNAESQFEFSPLKAYLLLHFLFARLTSSLLVTQAVRPVFQTSGGSPSQFRP